MRAVLQRVTSASVEVDGRVVSEIGQGLLVLVGIHASDLPSDADHICRKVLNMRLFPNEKSGKTWDQSVMQRNFEVLLVSQFTLYGILKGNKPDFHVAMQPEKAKFFYASVVDKFRKAYSHDAVKDGVFGAMMKVNLVNDGPVTMQLDSPQPGMAPRKQLPTNSGRENLTWTRDMDDALIDAFMHECEKGNKVSGTFTTTAYDNIVNELSALFGRKIDKDKVKNRWKTLKKNFSDVYDIFKNGMSGFAWNPTTHLWDAEPEVWDALIQSKPKAAYWKITPIPNYEKMVKLYGNDRATGEEAETAPEMRKRGYSATEQDFFESFDDLDNRISRNEVFLENIDASVDDGNGNSFNFSAHGMLSQEPSPTASTDSKKKVSKVASNKRKDSEANEITGAMHAVAEALREGNATMREQQNYKLPPISGEETWNLIKECGFDTNSLATIFCSLMKDVDKLRPILQLPAEARKAVIMEMVFGSSDLPS